MADFLVKQIDNDFFPHKAPVLTSWGQQIYLRHVPDRTLTFAWQD
ncbi:MAG: hypothetical protein WAK55_17695 [Xanthobacteraceae bacterium]